MRAVRPALVVGLPVSGLAFAVMHGSTDPWLFGYYALFGVCTGLMAIISRGVEATTVNTLMADARRSLSTDPPTPATRPC